MERFKPQYHQEYGPIYNLFEFIFTVLKLLNPFEWSKELAELIWKRRRKAGSGEHCPLKYKRNAVDAYIFAKWALLLLLWTFSAKGAFWTVVIWYLIYANIFSFFYVFVWKQPKHVMDNFLARRRFLNMLQAVAFSYFCFAYLIRFPYEADFNWGVPADTTVDISRKSVHAIWFSISNAAAGNYDVIKPAKDGAYTICMTEFVLTFIFVAIILSKAIPDVQKIEITTHPGDPNNPQ